jgi:hypothetical protein
MNSFLLCPKIQPLRGWRFPSYVTTGFTRGYSHLTPNGVTHLNGFFSFFPYASAPLRPLRLCVKF